MPADYSHPEYASRPLHAKRVENGTKCFAMLVIADITKTATQIIAYWRAV